MCAQYGLNQTEMLEVWNTFTEMVVYVNGGNTGVYRNVDLITGWESDMAIRIAGHPNELNMLAGDAIYYSPFVTPAITNYIGPLAK